MPGPNSVRAYFVEDNPTIRENLIATLEELGGVAPIGYAETEQQGSDWLAKHGSQWDLAIVDLFLKQGSGLGVLQACRERQPEQKVVVLTNYATPDIRVRCHQLGVDAVFDKSHDIEALIEFCLNMQETD
ncbi:MAG: response regulator [Pseudomonadota bacterium]|nr:response regulator [Pseudomonadota bacterium]